MWLIVLFLLLPTPAQAQQLKDAETVAREFLERACVVGLPEGRISQC